MVLRKAAVQRMIWHLEYWAALPFISFLRKLSPDRSSALVGWLMARIGPLMSRSRIAHENLSLIFPDLGLRDRRRIIRDMWENFGRTFGEFPHLPVILNDPGRIKFEGLDEMKATVREHKAVLLLTAHYGNFAMTTAAVRAAGLVQATLYRRMDNLRLEKLTRSFLDVTSGGGLIAKGEGNMRTMIGMLRRGISIGILVDQREKRGIKVPFLGIDAYTVHSPALLARRFGTPIYVGRATRVGGVQFLIECRQVPLQVTQDTKADIEAVTRRINDIFSDWIREYPEQWFWCHRRWEDKRNKPEAEAPSDERARQWAARPGQ